MDFDFDFDLPDLDGMSIHRVLQLLIFVGLLVLTFVLAVGHQPQYLGLLVAAFITNVILFCVPAEGWGTFWAFVLPVALGSGFLYFNV